MPARGGAGQGVVTPVTHPASIHPLAWEAMAVRGRHHLVIQPRLLILSTPAFAGVQSPLPQNSEKYFFAKTK